MQTPTKLTWPFLRVVSRSLLPESWIRSRELPVLNQTEISRSLRASRPTLSPCLALPRRDPPLSDGSHCVSEDQTPCAARLRFDSFSPFCDVWHNVNNCRATFSPQRGRPLFGVRMVGSNSGSHTASPGDPPADVVAV